MGRVRAARGVRPGIRGEHPVPAGGDEGDLDRLGVGDSGSEDCFPAPPTLQVDDPASQPYVTGVGGTSLDANTTTGARIGEGVWNDGTTVGAGGGGISSFWTMPGYQSRAPSFLHVINGRSSGANCAASSGDCREVPDVSADGDPATGYMIYWNGTGDRRGPQRAGGLAGRRRERGGAGVGGPDRAGQRVSRCDGTAMAR